jgi:hypothetical protein
MHRATPSNSSFRSYTAGGARAILQKVAGATSVVDDLKEIQELALGMMKGEGRKSVEHSQQYGFTSVPADPDPEKDGKPGVGPECFVQFLGGSRGLPVAGAVDDRRHRMKGLQPGDTAMFGQKDTGQQFHMNGVGTFLSAFAGAGKKLRFQLQKKEESSGQGGASTFAEGDGASGGEKKDELGQKPIYKSESVAHLEITDDGLSAVHKSHNLSLPDGTAVVVKDGEVYLGGDPAKGHTFAKVLTLQGASSNVNARIG